VELPELPKNGRMQGITESRPYIFGFVLFIAFLNGFLAFKEGCK